MKLQAEEVKKKKEQSIKFSVQQTKALQVLKLLKPSKSAVDINPLVNHAHLMDRFAG